MIGVPSFGVSLKLCCIIVGFGCVLQTQSFGNFFPKAKYAKDASIGQVARKRLADLHSMRDQLQKNRIRSSTKAVWTSAKVPPPSINRRNSLTSANDSLNTVGESHFLEEEDPSFGGFNNILENRMLPFSSMWNTLRNVFALKKTRDGFLTKILPDSHVLLNVIKLRNSMDPNLRDFLTGKYNSFLSKLVPYSEKIGVPPFVLNAMKISPHKDMHWHMIEKLLEKSSVEELIRQIPDFSTLKAPVMTGPSAEYNNYYEPLQSRVDEELVSDQEPDAIVKGQKKKYTSYGIRLGTRRNRPNKGDLAQAASSSAILGPERAGYEYSAYADQYGLYGHDSYDTYGKGYDEYNNKAYASGQSNAGSKGYDDYSYRGLKGTDKHLQASSSYGHHTHYSPKYGHSGGGYGHGGGGGGGGHGHSGYGHGGGGYGGGGGGHGGGGHGGGYGGGGSGWGWGGGGGMMKGFLDPFSILGTLSFLTFLGMLFQRSMMNNMMMPMNATGRAFSEVFSIGRRHHIPLTNLPLPTDDSTGSGSKRNKNKSRQIRSVEDHLRLKLEEVIASVRKDLDSAETFN